MTGSPRVKNLETADADAREKARALALLELKGCNRERLLQFVARLTKAKRLGHIPSELPGYKVQLSALEKAQESAAVLLSDTLVYGLLENPSPLLLSERERTRLMEAGGATVGQLTRAAKCLTPGDMERLKSLPKTLKMMSALVREWIGPSMKDQTGSPSRPMLRSLLPPNVVYYSVLLELREYVKKSTGRYHAKEISAILDYDEKKLNTEVLRAKQLLATRFSKEVVYKFFNIALAREQSATPKQRKS